MSITFKKKVSATPAARLPAGTRLNSGGTLLLTSSGIASLDAFVGGGLPIGSLLLVYEDANCNLSDSVLRCYFAEGVYSKHDLCVVALRNDPLENLPTKEDSLPPSDARVDEETEKMKIAWRYENLSSLDASAASAVHYDLQATKPMPNELLEQVQIHRLTWDDYRRSQSTLSYRMYLLHVLRKLLTTDYSSQQADKRILRIGIQSLSLSLFDDRPEQHFDELFAFLYHLRVLLRTSLATCVITLHERSKLFETAADLVFGLKVSQAIHGDYVAFCQLLKLPRLNTIQPLIPDTWDIGIKLIKHRRNLVFEKYSIPPDLSAEASREDKNKSSTCAPSKELDF